ncbi:MAG: hypothetical protein RLZZ236_1029 [Bacteroidota bacterium]|jgi:hypothetical protein
MKLKELPFLLLALLISTSSYTQTWNYNDRVSLFIEAKSQNTIVFVNDSLFYKNGKRFQLKSTPFPGKINDYLPINIAKKTFLVHSGCGPVLEFRNDSIIRVDNSYLHNSQFGSTPFIYNKQIYFFGGYGLFTYKNIITRFDFKNGEWNQEQTFGEEFPEARCCEVFSYRKNDQLYIFGGIANDPKKIREVNDVKPFFWKLDLASMTWKKMGTYNSELVSSQYNSIQIKDKLYLFNEILLEVDFEQNTVKKYDYSNHIVPKAMLVKNDTIYGIFEKNNGKIYFSKKTIQEIKGKYIGSESFILSYEGIDYRKYGLGGIIILFILIALNILYKKKIKKSPNTKITFNRKTNEFEFKQKKITSFEENEKKILYFLLEHPNEYVSLNSLNELFENAKQTETVTAIIKRRELAVNGLVAKVALITDLPESSLVLERKNSEDKRLKDILLLPNLIIEM